MYNKLSNFVPDQFPEESTSPSREFSLDDFVRDSEALKSGFVHDLESQRNLDPANALKAKEGVKEIFSDAMQKMKDQAENIQKEAHEQGYNDGHEEGFQAGAKEVRAEYESSLAALKTLTEEIKNIREQTYSQLEREMVELVTTLTRKIIRKTMADQGQGIREIVRLAVENALERKTLAIKVNPEDYRELQDYGQELIQLFHDIQSIKFDAHGAVPRGNCVVETGFGTIEAGLDHLDDHIAQILHLAPPAPPPVAPLAEPTDTVEPTAPEEAPQIDTPEPPIETDSFDEPFEVAETDEWDEAIDSTESLEPVDTLQPVEPAVTIEGVSEFGEALSDLPEPEGFAEPEITLHTGELDQPVDLQEPDEPIPDVETTLDVEPEPAMELLPDIELPDEEPSDFELPDIELPDEEPPDFELPDIELPDVDAFFDTDEPQDFIEPEISVETEEPDAPDSTLDTMAPEDSTEDDEPLNLIEEEVEWVDRTEEEEPEIDEQGSSDRSEEESELAHPLEEIAPEEGEFSSEDSDFEDIQELDKSIDNLDLGFPDHPEETFDSEDKDEPFDEEEPDAPGSVN